MRAGTRYGQEMLAAERAILDRLLREARGNVAEAARLSGLPLRTLWRRLDTTGLDPRSVRAEEAQVPESPGT